MRRPRSDREALVPRGAARAALGSSSREGLLELLGLDGVVPAAMALSGVLESGGVALEVGGSEASRALFEIGPDVPGTEAWVRTSALQVVHWGSTDGLPRSWVDAVTNLAPSRLAGLSWKSLVARLAADPDHGAVTEPMAPDPRQPTSTSADRVHWGEDWRWSDFFAEDLLRRCAMGSVGTLTFSRVLLHGDDECLQEQPWASGPLLPLAESPWRATTFEVDGVHEAWTTGGLGLWALPRLATTDLGERDVIAGAAGRARRALDDELSRPRENGPVLYNHTCLPTVIGEDWRPWVHETALAHGADVHVLTPDPRSAVEVFDSLARSLRRESGPRDHPPDPSGINLFGLARSPAFEDVRSALTVLGIRVHAVALPQLCTRSLPTATRASLSVFASNAAWEPFYGVLKEAFEVPSLHATAPYGWQGTRRWLDTILHALGRSPMPDALWQDLTGALTVRWARSCASAREMPIGLVAGHHAARYLCDPPRTFGVPLLSMLEEMGFPLEILLRHQDPAADALEIERIRAHLKDPSRHRLTMYDGPLDLEQKMRNSPAGVFFSEHSFDWRLSRAGKARFGLAAFEIGAAGAIRTAERLLALARSPFWSRYGPYLQRSPIGLRIPHRGGGESCRDHPIRVRGTGPAEPSLRTCWASTSPPTRSETPSSSSRGRTAA